MTVASIVVINRLLRPLVPRRARLAATTTTLTLPTSRAVPSAQPLPTDYNDSAGGVQMERQKTSRTPHRYRIKPIQPPTGNSTTTATSSVMMLRSAPLHETRTGNSDDPFQQHISPTRVTYTGKVTMPLTSTLHLVTPDEDAPGGVWPVFRLMDQNGEFRDPAEDGNEHRPTSQRLPSRQNIDVNDLTALRQYLINLYPFQAEEIQKSGLLHSRKYPFGDNNSDNTLLRAHQQLVRLRTMDEILLNAQRQGRISFYMTCRGEEAIHMGTASALDDRDTILAQYREQGLLMWRGFTLEQFTNQCFSNDLDLGKGRQMPVHYGSRALNFHTISSPLGTQLPQAVGVAYRLKLAKQPNIAICFFGEGCASTTDFHSALNFAATLHAPVIFFCRNNGYAISTSVEDQFAGDGVVRRAPGYGMAALRVDGNDIFAVHAAVREARKYALDRSAPVLIEAMTYRQGHHSTSDDSTRYRSVDEVHGAAQQHDPLQRLENFLFGQGLLSLADRANLQDEERLAVLGAMKKAEIRARPPLSDMFTDVYHELPPHLVQQQAQLKDHLTKYPGKYS